MHGQDRRQTVARLREQLAQWETVGGSGCTPFACQDRFLDRLLSAGGLQRGTLVEWLSAEAGCGTTMLALAMARDACHEGKAMVVVDRRAEFFPPAAAARGIDLARTILVQPASLADEVWAWDQALRCRGVGAVLGWPERVAGRTFRRWQLSAASGGGLGLLVRSAEWCDAPSWAQTRFLVRPLVTPSGRRLRVKLLRGAGGAGGQTVDLELDDETGALRLAAELAPAAAHGRAAGA
jgi:protein ImuA